MEKKGKSPKVSIAPNETRQARAVPENYAKLNPIWSFRLLDLDSRWCWTKMTQVECRNVMRHLGSLESMAWTDIEVRGSHLVQCTKLIADARKRLEEINQDDVDSLFSLYVTSRERVWGIREGATLRVLWWDPKHEVCPSHKK